MTDRKTSSRMLAAAYLILACFESNLTSSAFNAKRFVSSPQRYWQQKTHSCYYLNRKQLISRQVVFDVENLNHGKDDVSISGDNLSYVEAQSFDDVSDYSWMKTVDKKIKGEEITYRANVQIRSVMQLCQDGSHHAYTAESILHELEKLDLADTISYNSVINAYSKSRLHDSAERAERVLARMEKEHRKQTEMIMKYNQCVNQIQHSERFDDMNVIEECGILEFGEWKEPRLTVKPNVRTYSTVIDVYSKRSDADSVQVADTAQSLLDHMRTLYESTGDEDVKPNSISYNSVINAWAKTGTFLGAQNAMKLLSTMESEGIADVISYNAAIHAWSRCESNESGTMAEEILRRMQRRCSDADEIVSAIIKPNIRTFSSVIDAWSRCPQPFAAQRSQSILEEVEALYEKTGDTRVKPNTVAYSTVINAHARSRDMTNKASAALKVLKRMTHLFQSGKNDQAKPTIVTYNSVLNACATTYGNARSKKGSGILEEDGEYRVYQHLALTIVKSIYNELRSDKTTLRPDHFTYGTVLKACANLMSPGDDNESDFIKEVFEECCKDGQVSFGVCFQLRQAAPVDLYRELIPQEAMNLSNGHFNMDFMPTAWSRNMKERKRRIKQ